MLFTTKWKFISFCGENRKRCFLFCISNPKNYSYSLWEKQKVPLHLFIAFALHYRCRYMKAKKTSKMKVQRGWKSDSSVHYVNLNSKWCHLFFIFLHFFLFNMHYFLMKASVLSVIMIHTASRMLFVATSFCVSANESTGWCQTTIGTVKVNLVILCFQFSYVFY